MIKDLKYVKINTVNNLYPIYKMNEYIEEINGNKYLMLTNFFFFFFLIGIHSMQG